MNEVITHIDQIAGMGMAYMHNITVLIGTIILGLVLGLLGLKLSRVWAAFIGFVIGVGVGGLIAKAAGLTGMPSVGAMLGCALILAVLCCIFYKFGVFFFMIFLVAGSFVLLTSNQSLLFMGIGLALGLIVAALTIKAFDPIVIIITSICGGITAGTAAVSVIGQESNLTILIAVPAVLTIICVVVQFIMRSRQVGKKQAERADELKLQESRENEVEQARMLLDGDLDDIDLDEYDEDYEEDFEEDDPDEEDYYLDDDYEEDVLEDDDDFTIIE